MKTLVKALNEIKADYKPDTLEGEIRVAKGQIDRHHMQIEKIEGIFADFYKGLKTIAFTPFQDSFDFTQDFLKNTQSFYEKLVFSNLT